jgi:flagellar basal-body rod protein FlgG
MSSSSMHVAKTGLTAQQTRMQVISNNLSNVNTVGFKSDRINFESLLYQISRVAGDPTSEGTALTSPLALGTGVRAVNTEKKFSQGAMITTDNALDLAIDGDGFFQVLRPDGTFGYTRAGAFSREATGLLVTPSGYAIQPEITIPPGASNISISQDGVVTANLPGENLLTDLGQINIATFANPRGLTPTGENFYAATLASGEPNAGVPVQEGRGKLVQGALESSNVNVVHQLIEMIETQRAYEVSSKSITAADEMMRFISNNL